MPPDSDHTLDALPTDYRLQDYRLVGVLGGGGFGLSYRGEPLSGGDPVTIKEFLPHHLAVRTGVMVRGRTRYLKAEFDRRLQDFLDEAASLQRFGALDHIEPVIGWFRANGTGYLVNRFVPGVSLADHLASRDHRSGEGEVRALLRSLLDDLAVLHAAGVFHRDISPDTIMIRPDGAPVLVDFGAARRAAGYDIRTGALVAFSGEGYTPYEQYYRDGRQGAWTDLYALGAVAYRMVTGAPPPDGLRRRLEPDLCVPAVEVASGDCSPAFLAAIDWVLSPEVRRRPQTVAEWRAAIIGPPPGADGSGGAEVDGAGHEQKGPSPATAVASPTRIRHRMLVLAGVVSLVVVAVAAGVAAVVMSGSGKGGGPGEQPRPVPVVAGVPSGPEAVVEGEAGALRPGSVFRDCTDTDAAGAVVCPQMVVIPPGSFRMGSPEGEEGRRGNEGPQHTVTIATPLAVGRFPVTFEEWDGCVADGGCGARRPADKGWGRGRRPVINVSWDDAHRYVAWLSGRTGQPYRLLSEAEWEYAARAGSVKARYWGNRTGHKLANCNGCGSAWDGKQAAPVGSFPPNPFGLFDMLGNVWQWVEDCYHDGYGGAPDDGSAWTSGRCSYRILRGGSWFSSPSHLRSAYRGGSSPGYRGDDDGFRVVRAVILEPRR
jgi:formylglycine-generating enzyme required for sulfatase activity/tRNA A-37 threonylcarbamoyl transferase component Bud32